MTLCCPSYIIINDTGGFKLKIWLEYKKEYHQYRLLCMYSKHTLNIATQRWSECRPFASIGGLFSVTTDLKHQAGSNNIGSVTGLQRFLYKRLPLIKVDVTCSLFKGMAVEYRIGQNLQLVHGNGDVFI